MLGKSSLLKCIYIEGFTSFTVSDCGLPKDAEVLDIKFSTCYEDGYGVRESALIIYKEAV